MDSVHKNFYLEPNLKKVKPKKVANDQKIKLAPQYFFVFFFSKKGHILLFTTMTYVIVFSKKNGA
jgi:hypothetical protein